MITDTLKSSFNGHSWDWQEGEKLKSAGALMNVYIGKFWRLREKIGATFNNFKIEILFQTILQSYYY